MTDVSDRIREVRERVECSRCDGTGWANKESGWLLSRLEEVIDAVDVRRAGGV